MKKNIGQKSLWIAASALALQMSCGKPESKSDSRLDVTSVKHSPVKRQSIGNCWLYAHSTWLESMLLNTLDKVVDVSETYWTYWDFYWKVSGQRLYKEGDEDLATGGGWGLSTSIIKNHGWVEEGKFIMTADGLPADTEAMSRSQACAETYMLEALKEGGSLVGVTDSTAIHAALQKAFSCGGDYKVNLNPDGSIPEGLEVHSAQTTMLKDVKNPQRSQSLQYWVDRWSSVSPVSPYSKNSGKRLPSLETEKQSTDVVKRVMKALNDKQPVVMSFFVSFNAPNENGVFNTRTLADARELGSSGGHMVVLHDYTVTDVPGQEGGRLGEGDLSPELKNAALGGKLEMLVAKNSWSSDRADRPWIKDGFSRFSWDYLTSYYYDVELNKDYTDRYVFKSFGQEFILPPGY
ncbi:MAG TPA: hypothetical protein VE954_15895 [Oligoflexus sp.]|uniref:hypothetical protein n=1 Tax=Oligoflexus sp. TaxID=1971216 RepID=UPI002D2D27D9|nr:hypothetical protein [Oligoflexus sp.]HYX34582.1 hypothetical protein [Oligoflexus sp.]